MTICYLKIKSFFDADLVQEKFEKGRACFDYDLLRFISASVIRDQLICNLTFIVRDIFC